MRVFGPLKGESQAPQGLEGIYETAYSKKEPPRCGKVIPRYCRDVGFSSVLRQPFEKKQRQLDKWYRDKIILHRVYREFIKSEGRAALFDEKRRLYLNLSKFTHRSYLAICDGYTLGANDRLVHDAVTVTFSERGEEAEAMLVTPQIIASYFANLAELTRIFLEEVHQRGVLSEAQVSDAITKALEVDTVPRRFLPVRWLADQMQKRSGEAT